MGLVMRYLLFLGSSTRGFEDSTVSVITLLPLMMLACLTHPFCFLSEAYEIVLFSISCSDSSLDLSCLTVLKKKLLPFFVKLLSGPICETSSLVLLS